MTRPIHELDVSLPDLEQRIRELLDAPSEHGDTPNPNAPEEGQ